MKFDENDKYVKGYIFNNIYIFANIKPFVLHTVEVNVEPAATPDSIGPVYKNIKQLGADRLRGRVCACAPLLLSHRDNV